MATLSAIERSNLADALAAAGPDAPTLCEGWTAHDLAAHLVARERRPDSSLGLVVPPLAGWTDHVRRRFARRPFDELVALVRSGPPATSPFALPGVDARLNLAEHFVHCEDVRRADPSVGPRELAPGLQNALWKLLRVRGRAFFRRSTVGIVLATSDGREHVAAPGDPAVRVVGDPAELVLLAFGRGRRATVHRQGPPAALAAFDALDLSV